MGDDESSDSAEEGLQVNILPRKPPQTRQNASKRGRSDGRLQKRTERWTCYLKTHALKAHVA